MASTSKILMMAADAPPSLLPMLQFEPGLAHACDSTGYTLLHALASYNHVSLLREVVASFNLDVNVRDGDGETPLFVVETIEAAQCLVDLGAGVSLRNHEDFTAEDKFNEEQEYPEVAAWLKKRRLSSLAANGTVEDGSAHPADGGRGMSEALDLHERLRPLPKGITMNLTTMDEGSQEEEVDEEFRRRINALASRDDFAGRDGQRTLRELVSDAVRGTAMESRDTRRRLQ